MLRTYAALSVFGLLALVFILGLNAGGSAISGLLPGHSEFKPLVSIKNGEPLTLEIVEKEIIWRRDTLHRLRDLD